MDIETKIRHYQTPEAAISLVKETPVVLLVGIAGAGKDTIKKRLLKTGRFYDLVSHTTREPRKNNGQWEKDGADYHFIDNSTAATMLDDEAFIEAKFVHGTVYGTSLAELANARDQGKIAVTDIDVQGVAEYIKISPNVIPIFILPPNYDEWRRRLEARYENHEVFMKEWPKRRASAIREIQHVLDVSYYYFLVNSDIDESVEAAEQIATSPDINAPKNIVMREIATELLHAIEASS